MEEIRQPVRRILVINAITITLIILSQVVRFATGRSGDQTLLYTILLIVLLLFALAALRMNPPRASLLFYAWGGFAVTFVMVIIDAIREPDGLPGVAYAPGIGIIAIGSLLGFSDLLPYMVTYIIFALSFGIHYGGSDDIGASIVMAVMSASVGIAITDHVAWLKEELERVKEIIRRYRESKRRT
jgi:hypothetical protein